MQHCSRVKALLLVCFLAAGWAVPVSGQEYEYRYHTYAETVELLQEWVGTHSDLAELFSIGASATGTMELWVVEITNKATGPAEEKPAAYFDGNQHDSEPMGGEVALHLVWWLLTRYGEDPEVTELLDTRTVYVLPLANPEGAEYYITGQVTWDPFEIPNRDQHYAPGQRGADGPEDITGDGNFLQMRVEDPNGAWKPYPAEPRLLVPRGAEDTQGPFYRLYTEGYDSNGDGEVNSDPPFTRFITNRNYPAFWSSQDGQLRGAGHYPLDEPNSRKIVDFLLSRRNIALVESYHTTSGVHLRPFAARPDEEIPHHDLEDYIALLGQGSAFTGYPQASLYHEFTFLEEGVEADQQPGVRRGVFVDWTYAGYGAFSTTTELWTLEPFVNEVGWADIPVEERLFSIPGRYNRPDVLTQVLKWLDLNEGDPSLADQGFKDWTPFDHPTLGRVEIGGWTRFWLRNPPAGPFFERIAKDQARFAVVRGLATPLVRIREAKVERVTSTRWRLSVRVANTGWLDTSMQKARLTGIARPDQLTLRLSDGGSTEDPSTLEFPFMRGMRGGDLEFLYDGTWLIDAPAGTQVTVELRSEKGGVDRVTVPLDG